MNLNLLRHEHYAGEPAVRNGRTDPVQCFKCKQAWPCATRLLLDEVDNRDYEIKRFRALLEEAEVEQVTPL